MAAAGLRAEPVICSVVNDAIASAFSDPSYCIELPAILAPGSIVSVIGRELGPDAEETAEGFPLRSRLAGATVHFAVNDQAVEAFLLSVQRGRIRVLVPSRTPAGDGTIVVTQNGVQAPPFKVRIVPRHFEIYRTGPYARPRNVLAGGTTQVNDFLTPARPGQAVEVFGTGLGAVDSGEAGGPLSAAGLEVLLGLRPARVISAGPADCCAGLDRLVIEVPAGIEGCTVPVVIRPLMEELAGAFPSVAVASGGTCSDPNGMSEAARRRVAGNGGGRIGSVVLGQYGWTSDGLSASFTRYGNSYVIPPGACGYPLFTSLYRPGESFYLDAGPALQLSGSSGPLSAPQDFDDHNTELGSFYQRFFDSSALSPGAYSIQNADGGKDVGPLRISFALGQTPLEWTNRSALTAVRSGEDLTVTWTAGLQPEAYVAISGSFLEFGTDPNGYGLGGFTCVERAGKGSFTVPDWMLWINRVSAAEKLDIQLQYYRIQEFTAPGLDYGVFRYAPKPETVRATITRN
jgi:uncharacterized protein (TIGR03437 family)